MTTTLQSNIWSMGYGAFALMIIFCGVQLAKQELNKQKLATPVTKELATEDEANKGFDTGLLWLLFSATSVILMMSTTNAMTQNVPPTPFLWILPLCIYLLTYIICFNQDKWYVRKVWFALFACCSLAAVLMFFIGTQFDIGLQVFI
ncbi:MAG: cell division protein FtsW (lipid II flippase) [Phenylobacterium sp.]|jgi:cell division protein FtsW (lipid II flippase)